MNFTDFRSAVRLPDRRPSAAAYSLNVTVVPAGRLGYLTIWPTDRTSPWSPP